MRGAGVHGSSSHLPVCVLLVLYQLYSGDYAVWRTEGVDDGQVDTSLVFVLLCSPCEIMT